MKSPTFAQILEIIRLLATFLLLLSSLFANFHTTIASWQREVCTPYIKCKLRHSGYSKSYKVIDIPIERSYANFYLMFHSNRGPVSHSFRVMTAYWSKFLLSTGGYPTLMPSFGANAWTHIHIHNDRYTYGESHVFVPLTVSTCFMRVTDGQADRIAIALAASCEAR